MTRPYISLDQFLGIVVLNGGEIHSSFVHGMDCGGNFRLRMEAEADSKDMASDIEVPLVDK